MADELKPAYLLTGGDRPKIERALHRLRSRFGEEAVERLSGTAAGGEDAVAACNAMGLFGAGGRLVLVEDVDGRRNSEGRLVGGWKAADVKAVSDYLASPAPGTVLALVGEEIKKDSTLAKACAKAGAVLAYELQKRDLPKWVAGQFVLAGARASGDACRALVELVGEDAKELATEVDKLATWAAGDEIGVPEVELLVAAGAEVPPFVLTDAWGRRDVGAVLSACETILERSARELPALVGRLAAHVRRVRACQALDAEGVRPRDAAAQLKAHPFAVEKAFVQSRNFAAEELREAVVRLAGLDLALKGGSRLPPELELQRALVAITRRDEPAAERR